MTTAARLPCWQNLPRVARTTLALRNVLARHHAGPGRCHEHDGIAYQVCPGQALACYPIHITLEGAAGMMGIGIDCASIRPEVSLDVIEAISTEEQRREALEWLLMPWLEALETFTGCQWRICQVDLRQEPEWSEAIAVDVRLTDGRRAYLALSGNGLDLLARSCRPSVRKPPPWCRIDAAWLLALPALSLHEMRHITAGALVRIRPSVLQLQLRMVNGNKRMSAHWIDDEQVQIGGRVDEGNGLPAAFSNEAPLVSLEELSFEVDVVLTTQRFTVDEVAGLCKDAVIPLAQPVDGQNVALVHRGMVFARGELAYLEDEMVVVIKECAEPSR